MKVGISIHAAAILVSMPAIVLSLHPFQVRALGQETGSQTAATRIQKPAWLDGSGNDLRIKVAGEVFDESATPAHDSKLEVLLKTQFGKTSLPVTTQGNQFQFWVPVGNAAWFNLYLNATSADGRRVAREAISAFQLRQAAIDGLQLTLKHPERFVDVTVVENGKPVPEAFVAAELLAGGAPFTAKTNQMGVARFPLMYRDKLRQLTSWTDDFRIGGYSFYRDPPRDPMGDHHKIELDPCRPQVVRIIRDDDKSPVPGVAFRLTVGTGAPNYQFPGQTPACEMKTDENGEAVYRWFPDWKKHGSYVEIHDPRWTKASAEETVDGVIVVRIRNSRFEKRKHVAGQVESSDGNVAGFFVQMRSFQGEEKDSSDVLYAFTDENGKFEADYLPGSTYCIYVNDARHVSNIIDLIPYEPTVDTTNAPTLTISAGKLVDVVVTSGPEKRPVAHQWVHLETPHDYSWREDGERRRGGGGRRWWVTTDEQGKAHTFALAGKQIRGSIYNPEWRSNVSAEVKTDGVAQLEFHEQAARKIVGRLILAENLAADVSEAVIEIGSVDGDRNERLTRTASRNGEFDFESKASRIGIFARTKDSKAAAVAVIDRLDQPIELRLKPTGEFRGQLLGEGDRPLKGHAVRASLRVSGKRDYSKSWPTSFSAATFESETDGEGNYLLSGLPCEATLSIRVAAASDDADQDVYSDEFYLVPDESRPRTIIRIGNVETEREISFAERYEKTLRDCRLSHFHAMVLLFRPSDDMKEFVKVNFMDDETTMEVMSFMQLQPQAGEDTTNPVFAEFAKSKNWSIPEDGRIFACAMDPTGRELGRIEIDSKDPEGPKRAAQFIRDHAPLQVDAKQKWDEAFAAAKQSDRKVWVRISQRYCGPCFLLARWLDDQKEFLEQDYVLLKIDDVRDLHGADVAKRLTGGEWHGVPFHAIFDSDGTMLITSECPLGNIGYPNGFEGKKHLRNMLLETRRKMTDKQIDEIADTLND